MPKFRKKPVVIEAMQLRPDLLEGDTAAVAVKAYREKDRLREFAGKWVDWMWRGDGLVISTLEGDQLASPGDWIIKDVAGEFYPCKPDIFDQTYERVED